MTIDASGAAGADRVSALNEALLVELFDGGDRELFDVLEASAEEDASLHFRALAQGADAAAAAAACHAIKGTASSLGFDRAAACADRLMLAAEAGAPPRSADIAALEAAWEEGLTAFRTFGARLLGG